MAGLIYSFIFPRVCEDSIELQATNPAEMTQIAGYKFQVMAQGCGSNLNINIGKDYSPFFKMSPDSTKDFRSAGVIRQDGDSGKNTLFYVGHVLFAGLRTVGAFVSFADYHGTGELLFTGDIHKPLGVGLCGARAQEF